MQASGDLEHAYAYRRGSDVSLAQMQVLSLVEKERELGEPLHILQIGVSDAFSPVPFSTI